MKNPAAYKIAIAQLNPTVGDLKSNSEKIISWIHEAEENQTDLIVFPELSLTGYPIWDLANQSHFISKTQNYFSQIIAATRGKKVRVICGLIAKGSGKTHRSRNAAAFIENGKAQFIYKQLLPTYDVFLEDLFFEPGKASRLFRLKDRKLGITICEDMWDESYKVKPIKQLVSQGADLIVNISASPFYSGVLKKRFHVARQHSKQYKTPLLYVNQVGGQDDLIFDGRSFMLDASGKVIYQAPAFQEMVQYFEWTPSAPQPVTSFDATFKKEKEVYDALILGIRDYCRKNRFNKIILGLSGGIDSALVAVLAADALGPERVKAFTMPSDFSSRGSWEDSEELAKNLGIDFETHPIKKHYRTLLKTFQSYEKNKSSKNISLAMENLQARLRGLELMYYSNYEGRLLLSTGNKSELAVGYCTLYGDMCGGLAVLGDVYKTDVYRLCLYRNQLSRVIPKAIITKAPSAELRPGQKDQDSLPPYNVLDEILQRYIEKSQSPKEIFSGLRKKKISMDVVLEVLKKVDHNEYKRRQTPPILRVTEKAWFGRRMPITNLFNSEV